MTTLRREPEYHRTDPIALSLSIATPETETRRDRSMSRWKKYSPALLFVFLPFLQDVTEGWHPHGNGRLGPVQDANPEADSSLFLGHRRARLPGTPPSANGKGVKEMPIIGQSS